MLVHAIQAFQDNYVFAIEAPGSERVALVDPGEAAPVIHWLESNNRRPAVILVTHHHRDHVGGVDAIRARYGVVPVFAGEGDRGRVAGDPTFLADGDTVDVIGRTAKVLHVPGHTRGHVAYYVPDDAANAGDLFSGDTIFACTIGNLFEGTPDDMFGSIARIRALPPGTRIWCAHEYTMQYVSEAAQADPGNQALARRLRKVVAQVGSGLPTVPLSLADELETNPFFRTDDRAKFRKLCED